MLEENLESQTNQPRPRSSKTTITVDRRWLIIVSIAAIYGAIKFADGFRGLDVNVVPDTPESSAEWPDAGGQLRLCSYKWWGLKRAEFIAESATYVDSDDPKKTKQNRWMIVQGSGPRLDRWGHERFPRVLFIDGYRDHDDFGTWMTIVDKEERWFDFRGVEK